MLLWNVLYRCFYFCFISCEIQSPVWYQVWESLSFCHFQKFGFQLSMVEQNIEEEKRGGGGGESEFIVLPSFLKWFACILKHLQKWLNL